MKITGIIAEYNPFHNGHAYQIAKIKEETDSDYVIVAMSGDFLPALLQNILPEPVSRSLHGWAVSTTCVLELKMQTLPS